MGFRAMPKSGSHPKSGTHDRNDIRHPSFFPRRLRSVFLTVLLMTLFTRLQSLGQAIPQSTLGAASQAPLSVDSQSEAELQKGIALTRQGRFQEAIPHFLAAQGRVADEYASNFNLALCYVATGEFPPAIRILNSLSKGGGIRPEVYNLLAQALIGNGQPEQAFEAFQKAVAMDPRNEKLYLFVADACMDHRNYDLGLKILKTGIEHLPQSPRLHYEKGIFSSFVDQADQADSELALASKLAPDSSIGYLAAAQKGLLDGEPPETIRAAREGIRKDPENYILLSILGQALIRNGVAPGQPEFEEAQKALERSVAERNDYWVSQQALGQIYLMAGHTEDAITHLETARQLSPSSPSVYSLLAIAYRKKGEQAKSKEMLSVLATMNQQQAAKYKLAAPDHMASYMGSRQQ